MTTKLIRTGASDGKECSGRSFFASRRRVGLALCLAALSICAAAFLPDSLYGPPAHPLALPLLHLSAVLVLVFVVGVPASSLKRMVVSATKGENYILRWPGHPFFTILLSGGKWLICFLAGPSVLAGAGYLYWSRCENPWIVDFLILAELSFGVVAFWIFMLLALSDLSRRRDLTPAAVPEVGYRMWCGWLVVVLTAAFLLLVNGGLLIASVNADHRKPLQGLLILAVGARLLSSRGPRLANHSGQSVEQHWYQFLVYPFRALRLWLGLTLFLTGLSVCAATVLPGWLNEPPTPLGALAAFHLSAVLVLVLVVGLACSALDCVLAAAAAGEPYHTRWRRNGILAILSSATKWIACFWAGPWVFAVAGCLYWLRCGEPSLVDFLILAELGVVGVAYWIFLLLTVIEGGRPRDLTPTAVIGMAHRLGWRGLVTVLTAALLVLIHGWFLTAGVEQFHRTPMNDLDRLNVMILLIGGELPPLIAEDPFDSGIVRLSPDEIIHGGLKQVLNPLRGLWMLVIVCASAAYFCIFFCRLLGVWCYRTRPADSCPGA